MLQDQRWKHDNHALLDEARAAMKEHNESLPKRESHYSRSKSSKMCLSSDLNVSKMYSLFCEKFPQFKLNVSEKTYRDFFWTQYNLRLGLPRSDTCSYCEKLYHRLIDAENEESRAEILIESNLHHAKAEQAYSQLKKDAELDKSNPQIILAADLQQVLFCPTVTHSNVFYQRPYSSYNQA